MLDAGTYRRKRALLRFVDTGDGRGELGLELRDPSSGG